MLGANWIPTVAGLVLAIGLGLQGIEGYPRVKMVGLLMAAIGGAVVGWAAKQYNVTGGSIPQASPPGVALKSDALGVIAAVDAIQKQEGVITRDERAAKAEAIAVVTTPPSEAVMEAVKAREVVAEAKKEVADMGRLK